MVDDDSAIAPLSEASDGDSAVRALWHLEKTRPGGAARSVTPYLRSEDAAVRRAATRCLVALGDTTSVADLMRAAEHASGSGEKRMFVDAVIYLKPAGVAQWCVAMFRANGWLLRKKEALCLAEFADAGVLDLVRESEVMIVWEGRDGISGEVTQKVVRRVLDRESGEQRSSTASR